MRIHSVTPNACGLKAGLRIDFLHAYAGAGLGMAVFANGVYGLSTVREIVFPKSPSLVSASGNRQSRMRTVVD